MLPRVRKELNVGQGPLRVGLDGCSLGGYVALELFLLRPNAFASLGVVQPAIGQGSAARYAERLAQAISVAGPRPLHIETSSLDPYRLPSKSLSDELTQLGVPNQFRLSKGPHNQPWLREVGTLEMLLWHDRQLENGVL
jgi:pimeloyl-ACP methyl ester carboxylesterase